MKKNITLFCRIHIGRGVELTAHADGNISITSNCKIFVRSGYLDYTHGSEYSSKAHRFTPNESSFTVCSHSGSFTNDRMLQVFDIRWAYMQMLRRSRSSNEAVRAQAAAVAGYAPVSSNLQAKKRLDAPYGASYDQCTDFLHGPNAIVHLKIISETD